VTLNYQVVDSGISNGYATAIGLAAIFGAFTLAICCGAAIQRRRPVKLPTAVATVATVATVAAPVVVAVTSRRASTVEARRASTVATVVPPISRRQSTIEGHRASTVTLREVA
jgi:hypothetical protein